MTLVYGKLPFIAMIIFAFVVFILSLWDIFYNQQWTQRILALYGIIIILVVVLLFLRTKKSTDVNTVKEFEKTLKGKLQHYKCPNCNGIFAIKKSKQENKKPFSLTCPDCGNIGKISPSPMSIIDEIPDKKSMKKDFTCEHCGEWVSIWAEGTDLYGDIKVNSCPYCGKSKSMAST